MMSCLSVRLAGEAALPRLLQLASPALPVGAYSYSQGLEAAVEAGIVTDEASALAWIEGLLRYPMARFEAPVWWRLYHGWRSGQDGVAAAWNARFLASRESAELRAETAQMGYSLMTLLGQLGWGDGARLSRLDPVGFPTAFSFAAAAASMAPEPALVAYLWAWCEGQAIAAMKLIPLGHAAGQRILFRLGEILPGIVAGVAVLGDDELCSAAPGLAILSSRHETQYSRLFRS